VPSTGAALQPAAVPQLRCPRCWSPRLFIPIAALTWRCAGCEWPFTLAAATVSTPAVPATTVPVANASGTVAAVTITGGTLTAVTVNGVQAGTTAGLYLVPVAGTIAITFSAAPTWAWALPALSAGVAAGATALTFAPTGTNVAFATGQVLITDPAGTSDLVTVTGAPTATSAGVSALAAAHLTGVLVTVAQASPQLSGTETVPLTTY
jgi:ribosomal protein L37AE/L43A